MALKIKKAVFPVAGLGTRFLPATKALPKEMLPLVDKPLIQYAVEEALAIGADTLIFVSGKGKRAIEDHFDSAPELESELERRAKHELLRYVRALLPKGVACVYIRQARPLGLGHAVACSEPVVTREPFAALLPDDFIDPRHGCLKQMLEAREAAGGGSVVAVEEVPSFRVCDYGIVGGSRRDGERTFQVERIAEKPSPSETRDRHAIVGRYILEPEVFDLLRETRAGVGGEIQLTDALRGLSERGTLAACEFAGRRYDCGSKLGYLEAIVEMGARHPECGADFRDYLKDYVGRARPARG